MTLAISKTSSLPSEPQLQLTVVPFDTAAEEILLLPRG
jgi:hypothetical protein